MEMNIQFFNLTFIPFYQSFIIFVEFQSCCRNKYAAKFIFFSNRSTTCPRIAQTVAASIPSRPPSTTIIFFVVSVDISA